MRSCSEILTRLEEAELRLNRWIADGKSLEVCDELTDLASLAVLAEDYRSAVRSGNSALLETLTRRARVALLEKTASDRSGTLLLFHSDNGLAEHLKRMYTDFAESLHCSAAPVHFGDGLQGLCVRKGDLLFAVHQHLKNETGIHCAGGEQCAVSALPLRGDVLTDGYSFEAFPHPDDRKFHRFKSCVRASRDSLTCESLSLRSAVQNRDLALSALAARLSTPVPPTEFIREYDFSRDILTDRRLRPNFPIGDLMPLFDSLLLAE